MVHWLSLLWRPSFDLWALCRPIYIEMSASMRRKRVTPAVHFRTASEVLIGHDCHELTVSCVHWGNRCAVCPFVITRVQRHPAQHGDEHWCCRRHENIGPVDTYQLSKVGVFKYCLTSSDTSRELQTTQALLITKTHNIRRAVFFLPVSEYCIRTCLIWRNFSRTCSHSFLVLCRVLLW